MFTGIVDHCGTITALEPQTNTLRALISCHFTAIEPGESIAVDGICLTAIEPRDHQFAVDISPETLRLTTAGKFALGSQLNLERALRMGDRLGGHWVMGHIDSRGRVLNRQKQADFVELVFGGLDSTAMNYVLKKGSIAVNGVSLTINEVSADGFQVMLIPHTLERTNLKNLTEGAEVNLEFDWMTRVIVSQLKELPLIKQLS